MLFLQTALVILIVALLPIIIYALTKCGREFDFISWLIYSRTRLILGFVLILLLSGLIALVPEAEIVLTAIGFNTDKSAVGLGIAVGGLLVSLIRGDDDNKK